MKVVGLTVAVVFSLIIYFGHKSQKTVPTLVAPPKKIEIDPDNIPVVEEPRNWSASNAAVRVGVPLDPPA